ARHLHSFPTRRSSDLTQGLKPAGDADHFLKHAASADQGGVPAVAHHNGLAQLKIWFALMNYGFFGLSQAKIARSRLPSDGPRCLAGFHRVAGSNHGHAGQDPHDRQVFDAMMRVTLRPVGEATADGHTLDVALVVTDIVTNLLQSAKRWK